MSDVKVRTGEVELRTCKLTKSLLKQMTLIHDWDQLRQVISPNIRSPFEDQRYKTLVGGSSQTAEEAEELKQLAEKRSFAEFMRDYTLGWVHGSVFGDEFKRYLLINVAPGEYVLYTNPTQDTWQKFKQIFVV